RRSDDCLVVVREARVDVRHEPDVSKAEAHRVKKLYALGRRVRFARDREENEGGPLGNLPRGIPRASGDRAEHAARVVSKRGGLRFVRGTLEPRNCLDRSFSRIQSATFGAHPTAIIAWHASSFIRLVRRHELTVQRLLTAVLVLAAVVT